MSVASFEVWDNWLTLFVFLFAVFQGTNNRVELCEALNYCKKNYDYLNIQSKLCRRSVKLSYVQVFNYGNSSLKSKPQITDRDSEVDTASGNKPRTEISEHVPASQHTVATSEKVFAKKSKPQEEIVTVEIDVINDKSLSMWRRLMNMYRHYWYVAVPVHLVTSCMWYGAFYILATK